MAFLMTRKRLAKEREQVGDRLTLSELHESDQRSLYWDLSVSGPPDTPYAGKTFIVRIEYEPNYPFRSPLLTFQTPILHPNITLAGQSSNLLNEPWSPLYTIQTLYDRIQLLLQNPLESYGYNYEAMELFLKDPVQFAKEVAAFPTYPSIS